MLSAHHPQLHQQTEIHDVTPRGFGWKDAPSHAELASLLLSLTLWPLLHMADSGIPLKRKVRLLPLCLEPDPDSSQCLQVRPSMLCFLLLTSIYFSLSPHSSLCPSLSGGLSVLLGHLYPGVYLFHSWPPAGLCSVSFFQ